jgi:hypothetical protein
MEKPGPLVASGRAADVYALGDRLVLRRYRDGTSCELPLSGLPAALGDTLRHVFARSFLASFDRQVLLSYLSVVAGRRKEDPNVLPEERRRIDRLVDRNR